MIAPYRSFISKFNELYNKHLLKSEITICQKICDESKRSDIISKLKYHWYTKKNHRFKTAIFDILISCRAAI